MAYIIGEEDDLAARWKLLDKDVFAKCIFIENDENWVILIHVEDLNFKKKKDNESKHIRKEMNNIINSYKSTRPDK